MIRAATPVLCLAAILACAPSTDTAPPPATPAAAPATRDMKPVAAALAQSGMIAEGDRVVITGSAKDAQLVEDLAIEAMKVGGDPIITIGSNELSRRSYDEVPAKYDSQTPKLGLGFMGITDVQYTVDFGATDDLMKDVPKDRIVARAKAAQPMTEAGLKRTIKSVNLGNGLYPSAALAAGFGKSEAEMADIFWNAVAVPGDTLKADATKLLSALAAAKEFHLTSANGTDITFGLDAAKGFPSDGRLTAEMVKKGPAYAATWLPAGEVLVPVKAGTGTGKVVIDKLRNARGMVEGLTLTFANGKLTGMEAKSGLEFIKDSYDAAGAGKDILSALDLGVNKAVTLPTNTGRMVWVGAGNITVGMGDNRFWGGSNASEFSIFGGTTAPTLTADGKELIKDGKIVP